MADPFRAARRRPASRGAVDGRSGGVLEPIAAPRARAARHPLHRSRTLHGLRARVPHQVLPARDLPAADAAGVRSGPSVSDHLEPQPELRHRRAAPAAHEVRAREGPRRPASLRAAAGRHRVDDLRVPRGRHPPESRRPVSGRRDRQRAPVPHHSRHGHGDPRGWRRRSPGVGRPQLGRAALRNAVAAAGPNRRCRHGW